MALVHKFLMDDSGTELFRRLASQERARTRQAAEGTDLLSSLPGRTPESTRSMLEQLRSGTSYRRRLEQHLVELLSEI
jgi:hypothetical protein